MTDFSFILHDIASRSEVTGTKSTQLVRNSQETKTYNASLDLLCEKCATLDYQRMRSPDGQIHHYNWTKLKESASLGCRLCTFFTLAPLHPKSSSRSVFYSDSSGPLQFKILQTWQQETICLHVCVPQDKHTTAIYYVYLQTEKLGRIPYCGIKMSDSERDRLSVKAIEKITTWVQACKTEHVSCRWQTRPMPPTRVIDISPANMPGCIRLVEGESQSDMEYVALSHCWGNMPFNRFDLLSKCDTINIDSLRNGIQIDLLPKLYQDAIRLTRAIKKKYIWIDSLCIIQDSKEDWASECQRMSAIYSNCYLTISAMSYENNLRGFQHVRPEDLPPNYPLCPLPGYPGTQVCVRSMIDHKSRTDYLRYRGWAFQELLLSPRVLHFTSTAMVFECDTCTIFERGPGSDSLFGIDTDRKRLVHAASGILDNVRTEHYDRWLQLVQSYSQLELTYETDRLPALSGIASLVASKTNDVYVAGLWKEDIVAGLLWYVWPCQPASSTYIGPTWSWASTTAVWTLDPARRRFLNLEVVDVHAQLSTSNPYGEISTASLTVTGPLKRYATNRLIKKGHRYFVLKGDTPAIVRFALDTGLIKDLKSESFWCLDCTIDKAKDVEVACLSKRRETFFRPHGLVLIRCDDGKQSYKRAGVFEVYNITDADTAWYKVGFETTTMDII